MERFLTGEGLEFVGNPWEKMCVVWTLESMLTNMTGHRVKVDDQGREWRRQQLRRGKELWDSKEREAKVVARFDQWQITTLIKMLSSRNDEVGRILRTSEIWEMRGNWEYVKQLIGTGYQVGVRTIVPRPNGAGIHMFHAGMGSGGEVLNLSDYTQMAEVAGADIAKDFSRVYLESVTNGNGGWNILAMKPKS